MSQQITIADALLPSGWAQNVCIEWNDQGIIQRVSPNQTSALPGAALPGIANVHSHAHQRAIAGLTERSGGQRDSFWTWRQQMYAFVQAVNPEQLQAIAAQTYLECLLAGYTQVAEFQYLHHQPNGAVYDTVAEMSLRSLEAAADVGIGLSLATGYQFMTLNGNRGF